VIDNGNVTSASVLENHEVSPTSIIQGAEVRIGKQTVSYRPARPDCPGVLVPDTTSIKDFLGTRVRIYCRTCCRDWWHDLPFVPLSYIRSPRPGRLVREITEQKNCADCGESVGEGRYAERCIPCQKVRNTMLAAERKHLLRGGLPPKRQGCRHCRVSLLGPCAMHGGLPSAEKHRINAGAAARRRRERVAAAL
jgi:hypothetical protein